MTLADLVVLVVGCGLAIALPWHPVLRLGPEWVEQSALVLQILQRACLALGLVIFMRKARYGGPTRPAETLVLLCAMPFVVFEVEHLPWVSEPWIPAQNGSVEILEPGAHYRLWRRTAAIACAIAFLA